MVGRIWSDAVLRCLVLRSPSDPLSDRASHHLAVDGNGRGQRIPDSPLEPRLPVRSRDRGRKPLGFVHIDASGLEHAPDYLCAVCLVCCECLARPPSRDQDPPAATAEVLAIVHLRRAGTGLHSTSASLGLDAVTQPVRTVARAG